MYIRKEDRDFAKAIGLMVGAAVRVVWKSRHGETPEEEEQRLTELRKRLKDLGVS